MAKFKQGDLFEENLELQALREKERQLIQAQQEIKKLPAKLAQEKRDRDTTMPPMAEIQIRNDLKKFEQNLSRGQIENVLRTQRQSFMLMLLLLVTTALMLYWAYKVSFPSP